VVAKRDTEINQVYGVVAIKPYGKLNVCSES